MLVSVVVPVKEERDNIRPLFERVRDALKSGPAWELVYVDDGSTDDTFTQIETLTATDPESGCDGSSRGSGLADESAATKYPERARTRTRPRASSK